MASNIGYIRIQKECKEIILSQELQENGITIEPLSENLTEITGTIRGPPDSPYEDGTFLLDIRIPNEYPFKPPKIKFTTKIWHPNISSQTGAICLDILKDQWFVTDMLLRAASMTLRTVLLSVQSLLALPEPKDPQDAVVAKQFMNSTILFTKTAKFWTQHYAHGPGEKDKEMTRYITKLKEMGATESNAIATLSCKDWDLSKATESIFE